MAEEKKVIETARRSIISFAALNLLDFWPLDSPYETQVIPKLKKLFGIFTERLLGKKYSSYSSYSSY